MNISKISASVVAFLLTAFTALAANPSASHQHMTTHLESAMNWASHLISETSKGKDMSKEHVQQEVKGIRDAVQFIAETQVELATASPSDAAEGHFIALKKHQEKAAELVAKFDAERLKTKPDLSALKKLAKQILSELESAKREHDLELTEMESKH